MHINNRHSKGFSLVELMIAVAIIGILSAIAIPAYNSYITTTRVATAQLNLDTLRLFIEQYHDENNTYVAGVYDPGGVDTLRGPLNWNPEGDQGEYVYTVDASGCGAATIATCYTVNVNGFAGKVDLTETHQVP